MVIKKEAKAYHFLKEVNLFEGLDNKVINQIFRLGYVQNFKKGDLIIREGTHGGNLYILINGRAAVVKSVKGKGPNGRVLSKLNRGSVFGEMSVFDGAPYSASIRALENCDTHIMRGSDFIHFLRENPKIGVEMLCAIITSISNRLRRTNLELAGLDSRK